MLQHETGTRWFDKASVILRYLRKGCLFKEQERDGECAWQCAEQAVSPIRIVQKKDSDGTWHMRAMEYSCLWSLMCVLVRIARCILRDAL